MLLYTRVAPPKPPKRRSRSGCTYCKEKKKKCDEKRPKCTRCADHDVACTYEAIKPRQRRRRESAVSSISLPGHRSPVRRLSDVSYYSYDTDSFVRNGFGGHALSSYLDEAVISPSTSAFGDFSVAAFSPIGYIEGRREEAAPELLDEATRDVHSPGESSPNSTSTALIPRSSRSLHPDLAMIAPCPVGSPLLDFRSPAFSEFSDRPNRRALVDHFCNILSHLIVFREETGNPFQQLILPLTRESSPVTNAIFALACAHLEYRGVETAEKSLYFHNLAIRGVAQLIENNGAVSRNEILAAIMLLVYYECLVQEGRSNIVANHLKGALTIMCTVTDPSDPTSVFLERAFRFYDVITALSNGTAPLSAAPTPGCLPPLSPLGAPMASPLCNVDTLLGMATTLWPIIHRLAGLRALKNDLEAAMRAGATPSKLAVLRTEFESTAQAIETALLQWRPPYLPSEWTSFPEDCSTPGASATADTDTDTEVTNQQAIHLTPTPTSSTIVLNTNNTSNNVNQEHSRIASIYHNALAYRHASLVYLHRTILSSPRAHEAVRTHTRLALEHCVGTVRHAGPMSALLWPLFVSACEAATADDRALAERAFTAIEKRQGMRNIDRAWGIVREVWRRADGVASEGDGGLGEGADGIEGERVGEEESGEELWRRVSKEMGVSIVFG